MGDKEQFELPGQQELITDPEKLAQAAVGPDIHCPYCGARNPGNSEVCGQCGGDLKEGLRREAGEVLGAHQTGPVPERPCPFCGSPNPVNAPRCQNCGGDLVRKPEPLQAKAAQKAPSQKLIWIVVALALALCCGIIGIYAILSARTSDEIGIVQSVAWQRQVQIIEQLPAEHTAWLDQVPANAELGECRDRYRTTSNSPQPNSTEVCGTPYTVDQGSGVGKVVQDCQYEVYDSWCEYTQLEWQVVSIASAQEQDQQPYWPEFSLQPDQREGERDEAYQVIFLVDGKRYDYQVSAEDFGYFEPGSEWVLKINTFGAITDVQPK